MHLPCQKHRAGGAYAWLAASRSLDGAMLSMQATKNNNHQKVLRRKILEPAGTKEKGNATYLLTYCRKKLYFPQSNLHPGKGALGTAWTVRGDQVHGRPLLADLSMSGL